MKPFVGVFSVGFQNGTNPWGAHNINNGSGGGLYQGRVADQHTCVGLLHWRLCEKGLLIVMVALRCCMPKKGMVYNVCLCNRFISYISFIDWLFFLFALCYWFIFVVDLSFVLVRWVLWPCGDLRGHNLFVLRHPLESASCPAWERSAFYTDILLMCLYCALHRLKTKSHNNV